MKISLIQSLCLAFIITAASTLTLAQTTKLDGNPKFKHDEKFYVIHNKFKNTTSLMTSDLRVYDQILHVLAFRFITDYEKDKPTENVYLFIQSRSKEWQYLKGKYELLTIADGERISLGELLRTDSDVSSAFGTVSVFETLVCVMPYDTFTKLANAKSVEMKLGSVEFKLKDKHLEAMRDFGSRLTPSNSPSASQSPLNAEKSVAQTAVALQPTASTKPALTAEQHNQAGTDLFAQKKYSEAETAFREAVKLEPYNAAYHFNLGSALNIQNKFDEAEKEIELATRLAPNEEAYKKGLEVVRTNKSSRTVIKASNP